MGQFYSLLWDACGFWSLTNCGCGLQKEKKKKPHPAWVFLRKMPEKQSILFAWPKVRFLKSLGKGSFWGRGQISLQIIRLNTMADVNRVPKVRTSGE